MKALREMFDDAVEKFKNEAYARIEGEALCAPDSFISVEDLQHNAMIQKKSVLLECDRMKAEFDDLLGYERVSVQAMVEILKKQEELEAEDKKVDVSKLDDGACIGDLMGPEPDDEPVEVEREKITVVQPNPVDFGYIYYSYHLKHVQSGSDVADNGKYRIGEFIILYEDGSTGLDK